MTTTPATIQVVVYGPNGMPGEAMHVHAAGCADLKRRAHYVAADRSGERGWHITVATYRDVITAIYDPGDFDYDPDTDEICAYEGDVKVFPCVTFPDEAPEPTPPTAPATTFRVTSVERAHQDAAYSLFLDREVFPARDGWDARAEILIDGKVHDVLHLDRLDGEEERWHVSARIAASSSCPVFMNGLFSRCTIPQYATDALAGLLDETVAITDGATV